MGYEAIFPRSDKDVADAVVSTYFPLASFLKPPEGCLLVHCECLQQSTVVDDAIYPSSPSRRDEKDVQLRAAKGHARDALRSRNLGGFRQTFVRQNAPRRVKRCA